MEMVYNRSDSEILPEVKNLKTQFFTEVGVVKSVDDVSFKIRRGEVLGLVGESGCGKTTTARMLLRLLVPTDGEIRIKGIEIANIKKKDRIILRGDVPTLINHLPGCRFKGRCSRVTGKCKESPPFNEITAEHFVACWHPLED